MNKEIQQYLASDGGWDEGAKLFDAHIPRSEELRFRALMQLGPSPYRLQEMKAILTKYNSKNTADRLIDGTWLKEDWEQIPEAVKTLLLNTRLQYKIMVNNHSKLKATTDSTDLSLLAHEILDDDETLTDCFAQLDYYKEHKELPGKPNKYDWSEWSTYELSTRRNSLRTYVSKHKMNPTMTSKVRYWEAEIEAIEKHLA